MQKTLILAIWFIIVIKVLFIISELVYLFDEKRKINNDTAKFWKLKFEWLFNILMALVIIHIFYPRKNNMRNLTHEVRKLLFLYAILSLFSLLWTNIL